MAPHHDRPSEWLAPAARVDPLSDALQNVRLGGAIFFLWEITGDFATPVPDGAELAPDILPGAQTAVSFHAVTEGRCWASALPGSPMPLVAGDVLLVPRGSAYVMASSKEACERASLAAADRGFFVEMAAGELPFVIEDGSGEGPETRVICGFLGCDLFPFNPLLEALPSLLRVPAPAEPDSLPPLLERAVLEARRPTPGGREVLLRLSELIFVEVLRRCLTEDGSRATGWLAGARDPTVGRALHEIHTDPARDWTVEVLARTCGSSRSRFAERFGALVGVPPMQYLMQWRVQLAARRLVEGTDSIAEVAGSVGYSSEAAFSRAFKRATGQSPAAWRADRAARPTRGRMPMGTARDPSPL